MNIHVIAIALSLSLGIYAVAVQRGANIVKLDAKTAAMSAIWGLLELGAACAGYGIGHLVLGHAVKRFGEKADLVHAAGLSQAVNALEAEGIAVRSTQFWIHLLAGGLLAAVGIRMLLQAFKRKTLFEHRMESVDLRTDVVLSLRICLQALVVGIACGLLDTHLFFWMAAVFLFSAAFAAIGYISGRAYGAFMSDQAEGLGGGILCLLGMLLQLQ